MASYHLYVQNELNDKNEYALEGRIFNYLEKYFRLDFYGTKVIAPYFINTKRRKDLRALVGKGTPEEMILETKVWAQVKGLDLTTASATEIRELMLKVGIGIDCSGMIYHAFDNYFKEKYHFSFKRLLKFQNNNLRAKLARIFRPAENIGAIDLTSDSNTKAININDVRPGDLLKGIGKQRNAYHVAVVTKVFTHMQDDQEIVTEIQYSHSHRGYNEENGARKGKIIVTNPHGHFLDQDWQDNHSQDGINYLVENDLKPYPEESGFRRLILSM